MLILETTGSVTDEQLAEKFLHFMYECMRECPATSFTYDIQVVGEDTNGPIDYPTGVFDWYSMPVSATVQWKNAIMQAATYDMLPVHARS